LLAHGPGGAQGLGVHGAGDGVRRVGLGVVVVAAEETLGVDGEVEELVGRALLILGDAEDAQGLPRRVRVGLGVASGAGDPACLLGVLLRIARRVAVHVHRVGLGDDVAAVVVVTRLLG